MNSIDTLKKLTEELPGIPKLSDLVEENNKGPHSIIYKVDHGTSFGFNLLNRPEVSVMELFVSKGTGFPEHVHDLEREWGLVYKGKLKVDIDGEEHIVSAGECIKFGEGELHSSEALEDTWLIAVAIPNIDGYPA